MTISGIKHTLRISRLYKGHSVKGLALLAGVSDTTVSRLEQGLAVGTDNLDKCLRALDLRLQLVTVGGETVKTPTAAELLRALGHGELVDQIDQKEDQNVSS